MSATTVDSSDEPTRGFSGSHLPAVSIVVLARPGQAGLGRCLDALADQQYPAERLEIIIVGWSSTDGTASLAASLARRRPGLRLRHVICAPQRGRAAARNHGWRRASGELIGFTLDSVIPSAEWVMAAASVFGPDVDVLGGPVVVPLPARPAVPMRQAAERVQIPWSGVNVFYRRALLARLGGFDERFSAGGHEDIDLALAAMRAGARFGVVERAVVVHERPATGWLAGLRDQQVHLEEALLYRKYPDLYRRHVRTRPPLGQYATTGMLLTAVAGLMSRQRRLARTSFCAWLALALVAFSRAVRGSSDHPRDLADLLLTTLVCPPATVGCRLAAALRYRIWWL